MKQIKKYGHKTEIALDLWIKLARAFNTLNKLSAKDISSHGVTQPQFAVLECLGHLGPLSLGELSKKMLVSGGNMTVVVDNLEKQRYVERIHDLKDRRTIYVRLTENGLQWFNDNFVLHANRIAQLMSVLNEKEQKQLSRLLKKLGLGAKNN